MLRKEERNLLKVKLILYTYTLYDLAAYIIISSNLDEHKNIFTLYHSMTSQMFHFPSTMGL